MISALMALLLLHPLAPKQEERVDKLAAFLCEAQPRLSFRRAKDWSEVKCRRLAGIYIEHEKDTGIHAALAVATSIQESDLVIRARSGVWIGKRDHGLMGVRYPSMFTRGLKEREMLLPKNNIKAGMRELAHWKGFKRCNHKARRRKRRKLPAHEWFLHYNNGTLVSSKWWQAHYAHRVAALYTVICDILEERPRELKQKKRYEPMKNDRRTKALVKILRRIDLRQAAAPPTVPQKRMGSVSAGGSKVLASGR